MLEIPASGSGHTPAASGTVFQPGDVLAERYRVVRFLAQGGMGEVYEAEDLELRQRVALKTISARPGGSIEAVTTDRFKREIALARSVTHPNVCRIFDLGQHTPPTGDRVTFLTMELLEGETLSRRLRRQGRLSLEESLPLVQQMAAALDAAHQAQIVHRDFKSENVFLVPTDDGLRAVVTDFGVARGDASNDGFAAQVTTTDIVGTPSYMAPEQVEGGQITPAADIYAFGVVIYEMVTGTVPFKGQTPLNTAVKRLKEAPPPPRTHVPDIPVRWEKTILRCLERAPSKRFDSVLEIPAALADVTQTTLDLSNRNRGLEPQATATHGPPRGSSVATASPTVQGMPRRDSMVAVRKEPESKAPLLGIALLVVLLLSAALFWYNERTKDRNRVVPRRAVAVLGFENITERPDSAWLSTALSEMLVTELSRGGSLRTIPRDNVSQALAEVSTDSLTDMPGETLQRIHGLLGCDFVVHGSYTTVGTVGESTVRLDLRLQDAALGTTVASFDTQGTEADLFSMVGTLGTELRTALGIDRSGDEDPLVGLPKDPTAARLYAQALDQLQAHDPNAARTTLQEALALESDNPLLHSALATAWEASGYGERAAESALRAFELSSSLPREDRLEIEGRVREAEGNWMAAAEIYTVLWDYFPDDLEYGLRLATAENNARRPSQALRAVDRLTQLPPPLSDDPRIALAEANAAAQLAEPERQLDAARRADQRATMFGSSLMRAQARLAEAQALMRLGQLTEAEAAARDAGQLFGVSGNPEGSALALTTVANTLVARGELDAAEDSYRQAIATHETSGDRADKALGLNNLAFVLRKKGELDRAQRNYEEAAEIYAETANHLGTANTLNNLGVLMVERDDLSKALENFDRASEIWQDIGDPASVAFVLNNRAEVLRLQGRLADSRALHEQALEIRRQNAQAMTVPTSLNNLARVLLHLGEMANAEALLDESIALMETVGAPGPKADARHLRGTLRMFQNRLDEARVDYEEAFGMRQAMQLDRAIVESQLALAHLASIEGRTDEAMLLLDDVDRLCRGTCRDSDRALVHVIRARVQLARGQADAAAQEAQVALAMARGLERRSVSFEAETIAQLTAGLTASSSRGRVESLDRLAELEGEIASAGHVALRLDAGIAWAHLAKVAGRTAEAEARLEAIEGEAKALGFEVVAGRAQGL